MRKGKEKEVPSSEHHLLIPLFLQHRFVPQPHFPEGEERRLRLAEHMRHAMHLTCKSSGDFLVEDLATVEDSEDKELKDPVQVHT